MRFINIKNIFALYLTVSCLSVYSQQKDYDKELIDLVYADQMIDAVRYYTQYQDSIHHPFTIDSYHIMEAFHLNHLEDAIEILPSFLNKYYGNPVRDDHLPYFINSSLKSGDYEKALRIQEIIELFLTEKSISEQIREYIVKQGEWIRKWVYILCRMEIMNESEQDVHIPLQSGSCIAFSAQYNQVSLKTFFDTGNGAAFFVNKKNAEKIGIKMTEEYGNLNGSEVSAKFGVIDSVRIGSILVKNAPVLVLDGEYDDRCSNSTNNESQTEIIMGLPLMKLLSHIQIDWQNKEMTISLNEKEDTTTKSNMYIASLSLYVNTKINKWDYSVLFDTGFTSDTLSIIIGNEFYQNHKQDFPVVSEKPDIINACPIHGRMNMTYIKSAYLELQIDNNTIDMQKETIILTGDTSFGVINRGLLGFGLFRKIKKLTLDFKSMRLECE
jgi:hypothetical protein